MTQTVIIYACIYPKHSQYTFGLGYKYFVLECPITSTSEGLVTVNMGSIGVFQACEVHLDRLALDRRGTVLHKSLEVRFYSDFERAYRNVLTRAYPYKRRSSLIDYDGLFIPDSSEVRDAIKILDPPYPITKKSVMRAYREHAKANHPDLGGYADTFHVGKRAQKVLMKALNWWKIDTIAYPERLEASN